MATFDSVNPARPSEVIGTYPMQGPPPTSTGPSRRPPPPSAGGPGCRSPPGPV